MLKLYSPGKIGKVELKNRLIMAPMALGYCKKGLITDRMIEFFRLRASGGVGLIILGALQVDPIRKTEYDAVYINDDSTIPGLRRLTDAVHTEGSKIFGQLFHAGRYARSREYGGMKAAAPSAVPSRYTGETPHELTELEISDIISYFAAGAKRAVQSGFDGVEICTNSGYLIGQFLSSVTNKRIDRYGGDLQDRMTFLLEIVTAVQEAVGPNIPVTVRLGGNDFMEGGNTNFEAKQIAIALEKAGINALSITGGWHETHVPQITMEVPFGAFRYLGQGIKESVSIPVIMSNRINISIAEKIIDEGIVDFIAMARPFIADPELANKASQGKYDEIRPCVACNQGCLDHIMSHKSVECLCNAEAGRESELLQGCILPSQIKSSNPQKVLVVGAGVGGLEYARVAAMRGHCVTIWEQNDKPGGQIEIASSPPGRFDFMYLAQYLSRACEKLSVNIQYNKIAAKADILARINEGVFDRVVIATGAIPIVPNIPIEEGANVVQGWEVLKKKSVVGSRVVIVGAGAVGVETALMLAGIGTIDAETLRHLMLYQAEKTEDLFRLLTHGCKQISLVEMSEWIGKDIGVSSRWPMLARLKQLNVEVFKRTKVVSIKKDGVWVEKPEGLEFINADTVVLTVGSRSNNNLFKELNGNIKNLNIIGDALKPRRISEAIKEAYNEAIRF
ncbi:FAD-dependent oxidoreductase [Desulfitobacterium sp. Sab5]|uniref:oxidoreductase n=1 Tax=Desulfitobacterium nosdiversum TaxID=3375356 RepID=UPI003CFABC15